jgi:hypothetical protein
MPQLDHIIILVPSLETALAYNSAGFAVAPGGQHADGLTENALIVLTDGVYIELITFSTSTTSAQRTRHWWGTKGDGLIDWSIAESAGRNLIEEIGENEAYGLPVQGGRRTPDGKELKWDVVFPNKGERGRLPFFCSDKTPREWRVIYSLFLRKFTQLIHRERSLKQVQYTRMALMAFKSLPCLQTQTHCRNI